MTIEGIERYNQSGHSMTCFSFEVGEVVDDGTEDGDEDDTEGE